MVEGTRLLIWRTLTGTEGSNPSLSAKTKGFSAFRHIVNQTRQQPSRSNLDQNFGELSLTIVPVACSKRAISSTRRS